MISALPASGIPAAQSVDDTVMPASGEAAMASMRNRVLLMHTGKAYGLRDLDDSAKAMIGQAHLQGYDPATAWTSGALDQCRREGRESTAQALQDMYLRLTGKRHSQAMPEDNIGCSQTVHAYN